jgi:hypothetical protein
LPITRVSPNPRARAEVMKSADSVSIRLDRSVRMISGAR